MIVDPLRYRVSDALFFLNSKQAYLQIDEVQKCLSPNLGCYFSVLGETKVSVEKDAQNN